MAGKHLEQLHTGQPLNFKNMGLTKKKVQDKIEIVSEHKHIQIRYANQILEDGIVISSVFEREVISCGQWDKAEEHNVKSIADIVWTEQIINSFLQLKIKTDETN
jgi:hypothetical protein